MPEMSFAEVGNLLERVLDEPVSVERGNQHLYEDFNLDSLGAVSLLIEIQRRYQVRIPDEELPRILTVDDLRRAICERRAAQEARVA